MKALLAAALVIVGFSAAYAAKLAFDGKFIAPHETYLVGYDNEADCKGDAGRWDAENGMCLFAVSDSVKVTSVGASYKLEVETVGANGHSCFFEGNASRVSAKELVAFAKTTDFALDKETGKYVDVPASCKVTVNFEDADTVSVTNEGSCQEFCGARAWLSVDHAKRQ